MPTKKVSKKVVAKKTVKKSPSKQPHILHRHISVASPLGFLLALAFLVAAGAVGAAGYRAIMAKPVGVNEVRMQESEKYTTLSGVLSRDYVTRGAVARYVLTTSDNTKYELIGLNAGLLEKTMQKENSESREVKETMTLKRQAVEEKMEQKKSDTREQMANRKPVKETNARPTPMAEKDILSKNNKMMDAYVGKTITITGRNVGNPVAATPKGNRPTKVQTQVSLPQFVVNTITVVQ